MTNITKIVTNFGKQLAKITKKQGSKKQTDSIFDRLTELQPKKISVKDLENMSAKPPKPPKMLQPNGLYCALMKAQPKSIKDLDKMEKTVEESLLRIKI